MLSIGRLTPASGRQDHTTSPSAIRRSRQNAVRVHRILSRVRDDREPPLQRDRMGRLDRRSSVGRSGAWLLDLGTSALSGTFERRARAGHDRPGRSVLATGAAVAAASAVSQVLPAGAKVGFYEKGNVRIRYAEIGSGFPLLVTPGGGLNSSMAARGGPLDRCHRTIPGMRLPTSTRAPQRVTAAILSQPVGHAPAKPDYMYDAGINVWAKEVRERQPGVGAGNREIPARSLSRAAGFRVQRLARFRQIMPRRR